MTTAANRQAQREAQRPRCAPGSCRLTDAGRCLHCGWPAATTANGVVGTAKRRALGRGLDALLAPSNAPAWEGGPPPGRFDDEAPDLVPPDLAGVRVVASSASQGLQMPITLLEGPAIAAPLPELEYLVRGIGLVAGGGAPHLLAGYGFSGKTVAAQSLALSLAAGLPVWGVHPVAAQRVLHVDMEQGERLTRRRYQRLARAAGIDLASLGEALALAVMPPVTLTEACANGWRELMAGRDLVIIDSLRAASAGQDENDSSIRSGLDMLGGLSEATSCRALVLHHARKAGPDDPGGRYAIRGSSAIFDGVDSAYLFGSAKGEPVHVEQVKARSHGEPVADFALVISDVEGDGDPKAGLRVQVHGVELVAERRAARAETARKDQARRDAEAVRTALAKHPGLGTTALRGTTGLSGDRCAAALASLGPLVDVREDVQGKARTKRHYLRGGE
jgi:hypothetical protein